MIVGRQPLLALVELLLREVKPVHVFVYQLLYIRYPVFYFCKNRPDFIYSVAQILDRTDFLVCGSDNVGKTRTGCGSSIGNIIGRIESFGNPIGILHKIILFLKLIILTDHKPCGINFINLKERKIKFLVLVGIICSGIFIFLKKIPVFLIY